MLINRRNLRPIEYSNFWYVNPHTRELCCFPVPSDGSLSRTREALIGQGVTQMGYWMKKDFMNWGVCSILRWDFDKYAKGARFLKPSIERKRAEIERYKKLKRRSANA